MDRNDAIAIIRAELKRRSGKTWSVTGGTGTAYGWITIDAPPARRTAHRSLKAGLTVGHELSDYDDVDTGVKGGHITPAERAELGALLSVTVYDSGVSIPASTAHRIEYVARAKGENPEPTPAYWD